MHNKIKKVTEKVPTEVTLPDGIYTGIWGGYSIDVTIDNKQYEITTLEGVRGINIKVVIEVKNGEVTFDTINN